nr:immunoglobulin light chain junction region [Macaca mulatta]MOV77468.1 immunoglobulin light chain junction region [Macaca mulatta]MOW34543.1 immunoglobulin light chain junction region [Macaca mulatta]MOW34948.1 immunoglobulin light chain junction region [Macaca mulatta]MOW35623.1 immunoglobulin light chain junction region [Macaca mulatta]
CQQHDNSPYSF